MLSKVKRNGHRAKGAQIRALWQLALCALTSLVLSACALSRPVDGGPQTLENGPARAAGMAGMSGASGASASMVDGVTAGAIGVRAMEQGDDLLLQPEGPGVCSAGRCTTVAAPDQEVTGPGSRLCSYRIPYESPNWVWTQSGDPAANLRADADGNIYVVGSFANTIDFGTGPLTTHGFGDAFVTKLSPSCDPIWTKQFGGVDSLVSFEAVEVDPQGNVFVAGSLSGNVDFGVGALSTGDASGSWRAGALLMKLDARGEVLWNQVFIAISSSAQIGDVGVTAQGDVVVAGFGGTALRFDGSLPTETTEQATLFVAKLSGEGELLWHREMVDEDSFGFIAVDAQGRVAISGWALGGEAAIDGLLAVPAGSCSAYALMLDEAGEVQWVRQIDMFECVEWSGLLGLAAAFDSAGNVVIEHGRSTSRIDGSWEHGPSVLRKLDVAAGEDIWTHSSVYVGEGELGWLRVVAIDSADNIVHLQDLRPSFTLNGETFAVLGDSDFQVSKRDASGVLLWATQLGVRTPDLPWALSVDHQGAVWLGHDEPSGPDYADGDLVITKLAP